MQELVEVLGLVLVVAAVAWLGRLVPVVSPILLVLAGLVLSYVPGFPTYELDPDLVLVLLLPPLLYAAAIRTSVRSFRANLRPIGLLAVGLVLFTTLAVGLAVKAVVPDLPLAVAFAFGAVVAPPDAVAATAIARRTGMPRRVVTILEGESLFNDATALVTYRTALAAVGASVTLPAFGARLLLAAVGGVVVGLAVAWLVAQVRRRVQDVVLDTTLSLVGPYLAFVPAEEVHVSGVVAVVTAGLYLGHRSPVLLSAGARLQERALWSTVEFLLQGVVFTLIGLQLPGILAGLSGYPLGMVVGAALAAVAAVVLSRALWVFPATYLTRLVPGVRRRDPAPSWRYPAVISWAGMRGVVSLAAVEALPADLPRRDLLVFLTFVVIVATLVLQGLSLPWVVRRLRLPPPDPVQDALQEAGVQQEAVSAARRRLAELLPRVDGLPPHLAQRLHEVAELRGLAAWERLGSQERETPSAAFRRLRQEMLDVERAVFLRARDEGRLDQEVWDDVLRDLDLEEALLRRQ